MKLIIAYALAFVVFSEASAQYDLRKIHKVQGLSDNSITAILQDELGFVWIGTHDGLNRYDGQDVKVYSPANSNLRGQDISSLLLDEENQLWVGTIDGGVHLYLHELDSFQHFGPREGDISSIEALDVRSLHLDAKNRIWIGTKHGLNLYLPETQTFEVHRGIFQETLLRSVISDPSGIVWVGTFSEGLIRYDPDTKTTIQFTGDDDTPKPKISTLAYMPGGHILIGTRDQGLLIFNIETQQFDPFFDTTHPFSAYKNIRSLLVDQSDLWIGTDGDGVVALRRQQNQWVENTDFSSKLDTRILGNGVYALNKDRDGNIWIGSAWQGLKVLKRNANEVEYIWDMLADNPIPVWAIYADENKVWLGGHGNGLFIHQRDTRDVTNYKLTGKNPLGTNSVVSINKRADGRFWLGTYSDGLILFDPEKGQLEQYHSRQNTTNTIAANDVRDILADGDQTYWIATWGGGLSYLDERTGQFSTLEHVAGDLTSLSNVNVVDLERAASGKIWVGTFGGGVDLLDPKTGTFTQIPGTTKNVTCVHDDHRGNLWVGTWANGIRRLKILTNEPERFEQYPEISGKTICGILEDQNQNIWFTTSDGLYQYQDAEDTIVAYPDLSDDYRFGSYFQDEAGRMYFGGGNGVVSFDPSKMKLHSEYPEVRITTFEISNVPVRFGKGQPLNKPIHLADLIVLDHDQSVITFGFAAMNFPTSAGCEYAIQMEGLDADWRTTHESRRSTYTNLSPGEYIFKVKARLDKSPWPDTYTSIKLVVNKPIWATWYAYLIYTLALIGIFYLFRKYTIYWEKMRNQLKLEQLGREKESELHEVKLKFFTNISHEIRTPVTLIIGSINRLIEMGVTGKTQQMAIESIRKNGSHLLNLVSELLDFRKLESGEARLRVAKGDFGKFGKEIFLSFTELAARKDINFTWHQPETKLEVWYDRDEMEKVLYNLISNAFKYTDAKGSIAVRLSSDDQFAFVDIEDTGKGIPQGQLNSIFKRFYQTDNKITNSNGDGGYGIGLSIVHDIIKLHGGEIIAESEEGKGTNIKVKLQLGNEHISPDFLMESFLDSEQVEQYLVPDEKDEKSPIQFADLQDMTVLIVEDNPSIREYLHHLLHEHVKVIQAENGQEALDIAIDKLPDLVLTDVMMPIMDGVTLTGKLKSDKRTSHIPVIILTARTSLIYKKEGLDTGADDYLTKPFSEALLKTRIRNLLNNRALLREKYKTELLIEPDELAIRSPDQEFLTSITSYVEGNMINSDLTIDHIARELGMSQSNIYKKLKALTGMSIVEFIRDYRLKHAAQLIVNQKLSVSEACYKVGFNDRRYFSQVFRSKYGMTPSEYAKQNKAG